MQSASALAAPVDDFSPLDDPLEWLGFGRPLAGPQSRWESNFVIAGMRRAACSLAVEDARRTAPP